MRKFLAASAITLTYLTSSAFAGGADPMVPLTDSQPGHFIVGGRIGFGVGTQRQATIFTAPAGDGGTINYLKNYSALYGLVGGVYGRIGSFIGHYLYVAATASYNPQSVKRERMEYDSGQFTVKYTHTYDVGGMLGIRWRPNSVIYARAAYSNLRVKAGPNLRLTNAALENYSTSRDGAEIGFGIDTYFWNRLVATVEFNHGFYKKSYQDYFTSDGSYLRIANTFSTNTITAGLGVSFF